MKVTFPATYSTLSPSALAALISEKYGFENVECQLISRGVGDTYQLNSTEGRFIIRAYRNSHRSLPQIQEEMALLLELKKNKVAASYPIADISGQLIQAVEAVEGTRHFVLFSYAPGQSVRILNEGQLRSFGHEMAKFHNVSSQIEIGPHRWHFNTRTTLFQPLELLRPYFANAPEDLAWLHQKAIEVQKKLEVLDTSEFSSGYCHFDFLPKNFHFEGDAITFFDFDFMGSGWLVNDIMSFWQHLCLDVFTGRLSQEEADRSYSVFISAYLECRPISEEEISTVPYLSLGFWLFYMGFHTTHDQFFPFLQPSHLKFYVGFLRQLVERHWAREVAAN